MSGRGAARGGSKRDTARDIILGLDPSGSGGRENRTGKIPQLDPPDPAAFRGPPSSGGDPVLEARMANSERGNKSLMDQILQMQAQNRQTQRLHDEQLHQEQEGRRRLEANLRATNDAIGRLSTSSKSGETESLAQDIQATKQAKAQLEAQVLRLATDLNHLKRIVDQHSNDLMGLNGEVKSRPAIDPSKINSNQGNQMVDARIRDLHGEVMSLRQAIDQEIQERRRNDQEHALNLSRLQSQVADQDGRRNDIIKQIADKDGLKSKEISEETKRLNEKITYITDEVTRSLGSRELKMRDENQDRYMTLEKAIKAELEARLTYEKEVRSYLESRYRSYGDEMDEVRKVVQSDRTKNKEKFMKLNEALAVIERHMEQGNRKVDRVMAAEIQSRKLHEKGLLSRLTEIEDRLHNHTGAMSKQVEIIRQGSSGRRPTTPQQIVAIPDFDNDGIRKEMEAIATDKHKMSMEGMLKLEEKMQRIERGLQRDTADLKNKVESSFGDEEPPKKGRKGDTTVVVADVDSDAVARLRHQLKKLTETQDEIEKSHAKMKEKIDKQLPNDIEELSMKVDNTKRQMEDKIEAEERQRHLQVKELQDDVSKIKNRPVRGVVVGGNQNQSGGSDIDDHRIKKLENDVNEAQVGVKKLAESVTTVKNVLSRRLDDESRNRERAMDKLEEKVRGT